MAVIKVQASLFSSIKTVGRALEKLESGDEIAVSSGQYKEQLTFHQSVNITGVSRKETILIGSLVVPKNVVVSIENMTLKVTDQIVVEGELKLKNVSIHGAKTNSLLSLETGITVCHNCLFDNAQYIAIAALADSIVEIKKCTFSNNGKAHIYVENSLVRINDSELYDAAHALWAKNESSIISNSNIIRNQSGTQIIVQNESTLQDSNSKIFDGKGNGILLNDNSKANLEFTSFRAHLLPQIWVQDSALTCINGDIQNGEESAIMLRSNGTATLKHTYIANNKLANIQLTMESRLQLDHCQVVNSGGIGIHIRDKSIVNLEQTTVEQSKLSQLYITDASIVSLKESTIKRGHQLGIYIENNSNCTVIASKLYEHPNTAITITDAELLLIESEIYRNAGNGLLSLQNGQVAIEQSTFYENEMPHIAGKENSTMTISNCNFSKGKSIYVIDHSNVIISNSLFQESEGVQIEVNDETKLSLNDCKIKKGMGNAIKGSKNSTLSIYDCQITEHRLPQIVVNDSSIFLRNSEILNGERNGLIIENNSDAHIQDSFISKHRYPQIWIDKHSVVEMKATQMTEGEESDIYVQNHSSVYAEQCVIQNDKFAFNVQAVNNSKIDLSLSVVENKVGEQFYIENNSFITHKVDE